MTTMRKQVAVAISGTQGHGGDVLDAVMAVVRQVEQERDALLQVLKTHEVYRVQRHLYERRLRMAWLSARARANRLRGEQDQSLLQRRRERDLAVWLHAEAVWQRDQLRVEADHQWAMRRQMGHRMVDADTELTGTVDLARWLLAESIWQRDQARERADKQLVKYVAVADELDRLRASAVVLPEDWRERLYSQASCESESRLIDRLVANLESWRPATVEAAPTTLCEKCRC